MCALALALCKHEYDFTPWSQQEQMSSKKRTSSCRGCGGDASPTQSNRDRVAIPLCFRALSAEMTAPPAAVERDALARCGIFTGLFACLFVRHLLRRRAQVFFASAACSVRESVDPFEFCSLSRRYLQQETC